MKKILSVLACALLMGAVHSQSPTTIKGVKTITTADTITHTLVPDDVVSLQATYVETSGTSAGKFYIEGSVDNVAWTHIDSSKSLTDVTTAQTVAVAVTSTTYLSYRARCSNTSSATGTFYFTLLRRPGERSEPMPVPAPMATTSSKYIPPSYPYSGSVTAWRMFGNITAAKP